VIRTCDPLLPKQQEGLQRHLTRCNYCQALVAQCIEMQAGAGGSRQSRPAPPHFEPPRHADVDPATLSEDVWYVNFIDQWFVFLMRSWCSRCDMGTLRSILLIALSGVALGGCAATLRVISPVETAVKATSMSAVEERHAAVISREDRQRFRQNLKKELYRQGGFARGAKLQLRYRFVKHDPGNRALRYFIGFGAGHAEMTVEVTFLDQFNQELGTVQVTDKVRGGIFGGPWIARKIASFAIESFKGQSVASARVASSVADRRLFPERHPAPTKPGQQELASRAIPEKLKLMVEDIVTGVKQNASKVMPCIKTARADGEILPGTYELILDWTIKPDGSVTGARLKGPTSVLGTSLPSCFAEAMREWKFPASAKGAPVRNFPFEPFTVK